jgi:GMP synthase (glutamine-hydrolysing)
LSFSFGEDAKSGRRSEMDKKILIVKHVEQEGPGRIETFFRNDGWKLETVELGLGEKLPDTPDDYAAAIVLGGPMNVYEVDKYPFLEDEENFMRKALIEELPLLGICLGGQLLAKTCGAKVRKAAAREIGWYTVNLTQEGVRDSLFRDLPDRLKVFQWHGDTFGIPAEGIFLVRGRICRNQAFRVGRSAYGLQFHFEVTDSIIEEWMKEEKGKADTARILDDTRILKEEFEAVTSVLLTNFKGLIESSLRVKKIMKIFVEDERKTKKKSIRWWNVKEHSFSPAEGM